MRIVSAKSTVTASALVTLMTLSGCITGGTTTDFANATTAMRGAMSATEPPSAADYKLSCGDIATRTANLRARYDAIEAEQRAAQRKQGIINAGLGIGATLIGGSAIANAGSVQAINNAATATRVASSALGSLAVQESSSSQLSSVNDATLIATRMAQLQRVAFDNGC